MTTWDLRAHPSNMPRIGAQNLLREGIISASAGTARYAADWRADRVWAPGDGVQTLFVALDDPTPVDYLFIAFHNLNDTATSLFLQRWTGSAWALVLSLNAPPDNAAIWRSFDAEDASAWRLVLNSPSAGEGDPLPAIAIISLGRALILDGDIQPGWSPPIFAAAGDVVDSVSADGLLLSRTLQRRPDETSLDLALTDDDWMRAHWRPIRERLIRQPFALCWTPQTPAQGCALAWTDGMPPPDRYRETGLMQIAWPLRMLDRRDVAASDTVQEEPPPPPDIPHIIAHIATPSDIWLTPAESIDPGWLATDDYPT